MSNASPAVQDFFNQYARGRSEQDVDLIASQYPDAFMFAGPKGARVAEKESVLAAVSKGQEFLKSLGYATVEEGDESSGGHRMTDLGENLLEVRVWRQASSSRRVQGSHSQIGSFRRPR